MYFQGVRTQVHNNGYIQTNISYKQNSLVGENKNKNRQDKETLKTWTMNQHQTANTETLNRETNIRG